MTQRGLLDRVGAASGAACFALIVVGNTMTTGPGEQAHPTGEQVLAELGRASGSTYRLGLAMELLGLIAFLSFAAYTYRVLRDREAPRGWLGGAALGGAGLMLAIKIGSLAPVGAAYVDREGLDPQLAQALVDINGAAFVISWLPFAVFVGAAAASALGSGLVGRIFAGAGLVIAALTLAATLVPGLDLIEANPLPYLLGWVWTAALSVRWTLRPPSREPAEQPAAAGRVPAAA